MAATNSWCNTPLSPLSVFNVLSAENVNKKKIIEKIIGKTHKYATAFSVQEIETNLINGPKNGYNSCATRATLLLRHAYAFRFFFWVIFICLQVGFGRLDGLLEKHLLHF